MSVNPFEFVLIKSAVGSDLFMDIEGANKNPTTPIICWSKNAGPNQIWYYDAQNESIRSKMNDFCLEFQAGGNSLVVNPINQHNPYQKWLIEPPYIKLKPDPSLVITVNDDNPSKGVRVGVKQKGNQGGQQWSFERAGGYADMPAGFNPGAQTASGGGYGGYGGFGDQSYQPDKREFQICSMMDGNLVVDIKGDNAKEGANVIVYTNNRQRNQLWYLDDNRCIRSCLNDMVFYADDKGDRLKMTPYRGDRKQQWRIEGQRILNGEGLCLDIRGGKGHKGDDLCAYDYKGQENQHWRISY